MNIINKSLVSIGIPVFNGGSYLMESLKMILDQTYTKLEIIVSDDKSDDGSYEFLKKIAEKDRRIKLFQQKQKIGSVQNFNFVLKKAKGKYFFWAAQDDLHDKQFVETLLKVIQRDPSISLAMCDYRNLLHKKKYKIYEPPSEKIISKVDSLAYFLKTHNLSLFYGLHRTNVLKQIGGYHTDLRPYFKSSDFLMIFKILLFGKLGFVENVLFYKRDTGLYTNEFSNLQHQPFRTLINKILRYALFPFHYIFDFIFGCYYLLMSDLRFIDKVCVLFWLTKCTLRLFGGYIVKSTKGSMILFRRMIRV